MDLNLKTVRRIVREARAAISAEWSRLESLRTELTTPDARFNGHPDARPARIAELVQAARHHLRSADGQLQHAVQELNDAVLHPSRKEGGE